MNFDLDQITDDLKRKDFVALAMDVLGEVAKLVGGATANRAAEVVTVLRVIFKSLEENYKGTLSPEAARHELQKLIDAISANDTAVDEALKKKFHPNEDE